MAFVRDVGPNGGELVNIQMVENATKEVLCGWNTLAQEPTDAYARMMADTVISSTYGAVRVLMLGLGCGAIAGAILCRA